MAVIYIWLSICVGRTRTLEIFNEDEKLTLASWWETLKSDENAIYDHEIEINCSNISPQITWGTDPSQTINIDEIVPHNSDRNSMRYSKNLKSL